MSWLGPLTPPESEVAMLGAVTDVQPFRLTERPGRAVLVRGGRGGEMQTDWLSDGGALRGDEMMRRLGAERCSSWVSESTINRARARHRVSLNDTETEQESTDDRTVPER